MTQQLETVFIFTLVTGKVEVVVVVVVSVVVVVLIANFIISGLARHCENTCTGKLVVVVVVVVVTVVVVVVTVQASAADRREVTTHGTDTDYS